MKTTIATSCAIAVAAALGGASFAQTASAAYPEQTVRIVVGYTPGSGPDATARLLAQGLADHFGQPVVVDNRAGAGGRLAAQYVASSTADGYTLLLGDLGAIAIAPSAFSQLNYDSATDFDPISIIVQTDFVLVVPNDTDAKDVSEFVANAKATTERGDRLDFGTFGAGTSGHFAGEMFARQNDFAIEPIHFKSTGDAASAVVSGDIDAALFSTAAAAPLVTANRLRGLAITAPERSTVLPNVPTFAELGFTEADFSSWFGLFAPAGTPEAVQQRISEGVQAAVQSAGLRQKLTDAGMRVVGSSIEETESFVNDEFDRWSEVVKATGFKGD